MQTLSDNSETFSESTTREDLPTQILPTEILPTIKTKSDVSPTTTLSELEDFTTVQKESNENCAEKSFFAKNFCRMKTFYQSGKTWFSSLFG